MKSGIIIRILAVMLIAFCLVQPVMAEETNTTQDAATSFYNFGVKTLSTNDYQGAIDYFDRALASNVSMIRMSDGLLYLYQGKSFAQIQLGQYANAVSTSEIGLKEYPKDIKLWNNKGYASYKLGKFQDALDSYNKALSFEQNYTIALINKGDTLVKMGRFDEAVGAYEKALSTDAQNKDALSGLEAAKAGAAQASQMYTLLMIIIVIAAAAVTVWYVKFRKPAAVVEGTAEKKGKGKKK